MNEQLVLFNQNHMKLCEIAVINDPNQISLVKIVSNYVKLKLYVIVHTNNFLQNSDKLYLQLSFKQFSSMTVLMSNFVQLVSGLI